MRSIILLLFVFNVSLSQTIMSEKFNDFTLNNSTPGLIAHYILDGSDESTDHSGNGYTLTEITSSGGDSLLVGSVWYNGASSHFFDRDNSKGNGYFHVNNASVSLTNDFTWIVKCISTSNINDYNITILGYDYGRYMFDIEATVDAFRSRYYNGVWQAIQSGSNRDDGLPHVFINTKSSTAGNRLLRDGVQENINALQISAVLKNGNDLGIGIRPVAGLYDSNFQGYIYEVAILDIPIVQKEINEITYLANGWTSDKGNVYRDNWAFSQGFYDGDTLSHPVSNSTGIWQATFDAYGGKPGDAVTIYLGDGTPVTQVLTATSASYTVSLDTVTTSSDSLYMIASTGDTVYVDNLVVTQAIDATTERKRKFGSYGGWEGWLK